MISICPLLTEQEIEADFVRALERRFLPEYLFYWSPASVDAWLALCSDGPYRVFARSYALLDAQVDNITRFLPGGNLEVVSLGAGSGEKDRLLLSALAATQRGISYVPVDASQQLLESACRGAAALGWLHRGIKADVLNPSHLKTISTLLRPNRPRVYLVLGNNLGAWEPGLFLKALHDLMRDRDLLVVDGEIYRGAETLRGFENAPNRRFALAPLRFLGITADDGQLCFESSWCDDEKHFFTVRKHFRPHTDLHVALDGTVVDLPAHVKLEMSASGKFSHQGFTACMERSGFRCLWSDCGPDGAHMMAVAVRK